MEVSWSMRCRMEEQESRGGQGAVGAPDLSDEALNGGAGPPALTTPAYATQSG